MAKSSTAEKKRPRDEDAADAVAKKQKVKSVNVDSPAKVKKEKKEKADKKDKKEKKEKTDKKEKKEKKSKKPEPKPESDTSSDESESEQPAKAEPTETKPAKAKAEAPKAESTQDTSSDEAPSDSESNSNSDSDSEAASKTAPKATPKPKTSDTPIQSIESKPPGTGYFKPDFAPATPEFPLYTQTISMNTALFPVGFDAPAAAAAKQLLAPMLNRYSSIYHGVLLAYRKVVVAETPSRTGVSEATPDVAVKVQSRDEFAVGYAWVTAEVDLFVPAVGAWMEGEVVLQTEGHIGVVCWGKFNASIEASRLPRSWRWVAAEEAQFDLEDGDDAGASTSGHWIDGKGVRVDGKALFRVKRFDVGVRDDHSFISIEGSMLSDSEEDKTRADELQRDENRRAKASGYLMGRAKRVMDFAMTDCGVQDEEIRDIRSQIDWRRARPPTPTSYSMT